MKFVTTLTQYLRRLLTQPVGELSRGRRFLRYSIELTLHCRRALKHDRAGEMAAALTYRTIFSLVPMVVMGLLVFRAFGGFEQVGGQIQSFIYDKFGLTSLALPQTTETQPSPLTQQPPPQTQVQTPPPAPGAPPPTTPPSDQAQGKQEVRAQVDQLLYQLTTQVSEANFGSIGAVGLLVLIYAALRLLMTVEYNFNRIYNCPTTRSWVQQVVIYWSVITLGPVLLAVSFYVAGKLAEVLSVLGPMFSFLSYFTALAASWLLLFLTYLLMPNTQVRARPALIGSFVAAVLWEAGKWGFKLYVTKAVPYSALYGTLGLIPLFLYWVYLTWLIVLFGLELTYTLQAMKGRRFKYEAEDQKPDLPTDPQWLVPIIVRIGQAFAEGRAIGRQQIAEDLGLPARAVAELGEKLVGAKLVHQVQSEGDEGFSLAKPPERIAVADVLQISHTMTLPKDRNANQPAWDYLDHMVHELDETAGATSLATLLNGQSRAGASAH